MSVRRLVLPFVAAAVLAVSACSTPVPVAGGGGGGDTPPPPAADLPAWYGTDFDANGCPVPARGADLDVFPDAPAFLQSDVPDDWCMYSTISYLEYYAIPKHPSASWAADVRDALEPYAWAFDPIDDDSPDWSWITDYPSGSEAGFEDGQVDGSIVTVDAATAEDIRLKHDYFITLATGFGGDWKEGDELRVLGFW